ncbi:hypothetical protein NDU88_004224 [Pleurodeles waltl]|uniref:Uncharacterized protein n=1 Tax=Pleurodeles waltl TaxID=8319 RepID=A0AAV7TRB6_PLEWA|nr:hypothetical protein NDU88_004224 [Pleurodeles waltl]
MASRRRGWSLLYPEDAWRKNLKSSQEKGRSLSWEETRQWGKRREDNEEPPKRTNSAEARRCPRKKRRESETGSRENQRGQHLKDSEKETTRRSRPRSMRSVVPPGRFMRCTDEFMRSIMNYAMIRN